jgi:hypothetical protein
MPEFTINPNLIDDETGLPLLPANYYWLVEPEVSYFLYKVSLMRKVNIFVKIFTITTRNQRVDFNWACHQYKGHVWTDEEAKLDILRVAKETLNSQLTLAHFQEKKIVAGLIGKYPPRRLFEEPTNE